MSFRFPRRRLRAFFPVAVWGAAMWLYPDEPLWTGILGALAAAGAASVWWSDSRSALDAWQLRHPGLSFRGMTWFPADAAGSFDAVCAAVAQASEALREHRPQGRDERALRRRTRRELDGVLRLGARLALQIEQLERLPESARTAGVRGESTRAADRLASLPGAARRLRDALLRSGPAAAVPDIAPLAALLTIERGITAHSEALSELSGMERM
jgi:hypothetical protein